MSENGNGVLLPRYYLVHATPAGDRYVYPPPELEGYPKCWDPPEVAWTSPDGIVRDAGGWLVSDTMLGDVCASWLPPREPGERRKTTTPPGDPYSRQAWEAALDVPPAEEVEHFGHHDSEGCVRCNVFRAVYDREWVQPPAETRVVSFTGWMPLPGEQDPDPGTAWHVDDTSAVAVYGRHTAHLWPGSIPGFRAAVYERLKADPRVDYVFDAKNHSSSQPPGTLQTTVRVPWETPRTELKHRYGQRGQKLRGTRPVPVPVAHSARTTLFVPAELAAASKREALERWDQAVSEFVERLVPVDVVACDRCDGHGHLLRSQVPESGLAMADLREQYDG